MKYLDLARTATAAYGADQERVLTELRRYVDAITSDTLASHVDNAVKYAYTNLLREMVPALSASQLCAMLDLTLAAKATDYIYVSTFPLTGMPLARIVNDEQFAAAVTLSKAVLRKDFPIDALLEEALPVVATLGGDFTDSLRKLRGVLDRLAGLSAPEVVKPFLKDAIPAITAAATEPAGFWRTIDVVVDFALNANTPGVPVGAAIKGLCAPAVPGRQSEDLAAILRHALSNDLKRMAAQKPTCSTSAKGPPLQRFVEKGLPAAATPKADVEEYCANLDALADLYAALCRPDVDWWFINDEEMGKLATEAVELRMSRKGYDLQVTPHAGYVGASQNRFVMHAGGGIAPERVFYQTSVQSIRLIPTKARKRSPA